MTVSPVISENAAVAAHPPPPMAFPPPPSVTANTISERQLRFIEAIRRTGRGGIDRNDIVRRALDARIQKFIDDGAIAEKEGGEPESDSKKGGTDAEKDSPSKTKTEEG